ncbi:hypothetical protein [Magnetofaba australis]|uniref:hypothetical protein n=1 Tax=Magnetofaba australis TaxID=1472297 RepID=UPI000A19D845|nr:hypothetical protein [Magnetofaba australis]
MNGSPQTDRGRSSSYRMGIKGGIFSSPEHDFWPLIRSLPTTNALLVDAGLGTLGHGQFQSQTLQAHDWAGLMDLAVLIGGGNPSLNGDLLFSSQHHASVLQDMGGIDPTENVENVLIRGWGIRAILEWHCQGLPEWLGKDNTTAFHQLQNTLLIRLLRQIFRASLRGIHVWITFPLKSSTEMVGSNSRPFPDLPDEVVHELMCVSDLVLSVADVWKDGSLQTALITDHRNVWGYPAKASGALGLDPLEPTDIAALTRKVMASVRNVGPAEPMKERFAVNSNG